MHWIYKVGLVFYLLFSVSPIIILAQNSNLPAPVDTSYFSAGEDDLNLIESVIRNEPENVFLLLNRGANPDTKSKEDVTAVMYAVDSTRVLILKLLLVNGANPDLTYLENTTPLILAVLNNQFEAAEILLQKGADPDLRMTIKRLHCIMPRLLIIIRLQICWYFTVQTRISAIRMGMIL